MILPANDIPRNLGVMVLPGAALFPGSLLPLYIFEPRYRLMLARALEGDRMFAVASSKGEDISPIGGCGFIRACVGNKDGTSQLVLQGVQRVRFAGWDQIEPYRIATVEPLNSKNPCAPEAAELARELREFCSSLENQGIEFPSNFDEFLNQADDPGALGDLVGSTMVPDPELRQQLLEELDVPTRLKGLLACLKAQLTD